MPAELPSFSPPDGHDDTDHHWSSLARPVVDGILELLARIQPGSRHHVCMADLKTSNLVFSDNWFSDFVGSRGVRGLATDHHHALRISALVQAFKSYPAEAMEALMMRISEIWQQGNHTGRLSIYHILTGPTGTECPVVTQCQAAPMLTDDTGPILIANVTEVRHLSHPSAGPLLGATLLQDNGATFHWHLDPGDDSLVEKHFLSASELKILAMIEQGQSSRDIAQHLGTSPSTADTHRRNICRKLSCVDTTAAVQLCLLMGWL